MHVFRLEWQIGMITSFLRLLWKECLKYNVNSIAYFYSNMFVYNKCLIFVLRDTYIMWREVNNLHYIYETIHSDLEWR